MAPLGAAPNAELCVGRYTAQRVPGHVLIFAAGVHRSAGCVVFFRREAGDDFPPRFSLWHVRPHAPGLHAVTPFSAWTAFQTTRDVDQVQILDASGSQSITVDDVPERSREHQP